MASNVSLMGKYSTGGASMTNKEILEKAVQKAIDGGWNPPKWVVWAVVGGEGIEPYTFETGDEGYSVGWHDYDEFVSLKDIIFNHDFAKALWGNEMIECYHAKDVKCRMTAWAYHLQQMVIADDPIEYLGENI